MSLREHEEYAMHYPDPSHYASAAPSAMTMESYVGYPPRPAHEAFSANITFDPQGAMYGEAPARYMFHPSQSSPAMYPEDNDLTGPSSTLSTVSASSSNMGSPLSNHGQLSAIPEWAPTGLGVSPGIVDHAEYFPGAEYSFEMQAYHPPSYEYTTPKPPGYAGELSRIPRSNVSSYPRPVSEDPLSVVSPAPSRRLALNTQLAQTSFPMSPTATSASSTRSSLAFASPTSATSACFSSPPVPIWRSPDRMPRVAAPFFSQSSGHFVPPLQSSDPSMIHPDVRTMAMPGYEYPPPNGYPASPALSASPQMRTSTSPFPYNSNFGPFSPFQAPVDPNGRRPSIVSFQSNFSGDEAKEKQRCPHQDCGKIYKDLKAHMLTHQNERPEKCPIMTCEYHVKGFARKYDKNRHTLTHYKGTMVCGFCPGSGSAAEKSFNRADVFKRHLTAVHGVEQTPPNSRRKATGLSSANSNATKSLKAYAPDATGKCSTCSSTFSNAQDFYEHLDDCVLRIVQQEDPAEAINAKRLAEVEQDREVHETLEKNQLPTTTMTSMEVGDEGDEAMGEDEDAQTGDDDFNAGHSPKRAKATLSGGVQKSRGLTHSRGGPPVMNKNRGRKNRRDYPSSWGFDKGQMTMKKRVMAVFDGQRRLAKDDMMLSTEHEVRLRLQDGKSYVTDLDIQTLKRAEGFLSATDEEKGPWVSDDLSDEDRDTMLKLGPDMMSLLP